MNALIKRGGYDVALSPPGSLQRSHVSTPSGRTLAYFEGGSGPDVILLHGTLTAAEDMALALLPALQERCHVVAFDRPSHGASDRVAIADASLWSQASTLHDAALALGLRRPLVCGHSYGGAVALAMGMAYPDDVSGVVALAPVCFPEPRLEHVLFGTRALTLREAGAGLDPILLPILWNAMFLPQVMPAAFATAFPFALAGRTDRLVAEGDSANSLFADLTRSVLSYPACGVPVALLAGSADLVVNPWHSMAAAALIPGAAGRLLPRLGHMLHHFAPTIVEETITATLRAAYNDGKNA